MVTADTVDKALVSGTLQPLPRPLETQESAAPPQPPREAAEGPSRRRRRRRHRQTPGAMSAPPQDAAQRPEGAMMTAPPARGGAPLSPGASDARSGDQDEAPVYSEGPDDEGSLPTPPRAEAAAGPVMPRFAELPVTDALQGAPHHRRRRRRRHRGRGGPGTRSAGSPQGDARSAFGTQRGGVTPGGNGSADSSRREGAAPPRSEPALPPPSPRPSQDIDPGPPPAARVGADGVATDAQAEAKPKRRWWRRSFSRG